MLSKPGCVGSERADLLAVLDQRRLTGATLTSTEWIAKTSDPTAMKETPTPLPSMRP
jgi:hypothetical protein